MAEEQRFVSDQGQALRLEAMAICRQAGWPPRCLGQSGFTPGVSEIYEELRCLQQVLAVDVAQELIDCCRKHQQWTPLFEDVEARIALFNGDVDQAEAVWQRLVDYPSKVVQRIADKALRSLKTKRETGDQLMMDVIQALDRNQIASAHAMLLDALMEARNLEDEKLRDALEPVAMSRSKPDHFPWNRDLLIDQVVLDLFDHQLASWERHVG